MMALFMCTNDGILLDLTKHGYLPLYKDGITTTYISSSLTPAQAAAQGYYAVSGKMISKADALAIWNFLIGNTDALKLSFETNTADTYYNYDNDTVKTDSAKYVANSAISWFVKFIDGTTLINGKNAGNVIEYVTGTDSALKITLNRETGNLTCDVKLAGKSTTGYVNYTFSGDNDAYAVTAIDTSAIADGNKVVVDLNNEFYTLFKAAFGMGPGTSLDDGKHGINNSFYYVASAVNYDTTKKVYNSVTYTKGAIILIDAAQCYVLDSTGAYSTAKNYTISGNTLTVDSTDVYTIYGNSYKVVVKNA